MEIRKFEERDRDACRSIFAQLEQWFGISEAVEEYLAGLGSKPTWVAESGGELSGFLAVEPHTEDAAEIWVAAVVPERHREGIGRALVARAEHYCRRSGRRFLQVKTTAEGRPSAENAATRRAWLGLGFRLIETFSDLWNPANPTQQLVKVIPAATAQMRIDELGLHPHPEGGYFRETWRSERVLDLPDYDGPRNAGTCIHFLLPTGDRSAWHRVASDEIWLWQGGDPLELLIAPSPDADPDVIRLGGERLQAVVPGGEWQAARPVAGDHGYALVGCAVVPGFDFADFQM